MSEEIKTIQEYPKYIQLENGYKIVESKQEEDELLNPVKKEEKNEPASKNNSKGTNKKITNVDRFTGAGGESN